MMTRILIVIALLASSMSVWTNGDQFKAALDILRDQPYGSVYISIGQVLLIINLAAFMWRVILFLKYRPVEGCDNATLPTCTIIVPAYNEG